MIFQKTRNLIIKNPYSKKKTTVFVKTGKLTTTLIKNDKDSKTLSQVSSLTDLMLMCGIYHLRDRYPDELSGGEQQRVAVARALKNSPSIIFADEPSGNLDSRTAKELHDLLLKLNKEMNQTLVVITHNNTLANLANRKLEIKDGKII